MPVGSTPYPTRPAYMNILNNKIKKTQDATSSVVVYGYVYLIAV